ncbi:transcriptional repressor [Candidatus Woesearchaeota archaeon]|nr:transcriptional repressor [Candidatus Woesearchaeota archaeon]
MGRQTSQKKILIDGIMQFNSFFDAYMLHKSISGKSRLSLATTYRFLNSMESEGRIHSYVCNSKKIYSLHEKSHSHFKCEKCGKVKHIKIKNLDFLAGILDDEICHFQIELSGKCSDCKGQDLKPKENHKHIDLSDNL